jgi:hypothetical protein
MKEIFEIIFEKQKLKQINKITNLDYKVTRCNSVNAIFKVFFEFIEKSSINFFLICRDNIMFNRDQKKYFFEL